MQERSPAQPAITLALTFLAIALPFALPVQLIPGQEVFGKEVSTETANLYAFVAWAGWAHFLFAFRGQFKALSKGGSKKVIAYIGALTLIVAALAGARWAIGSALFGGLVWVYFIDHFLKAEQTFEGKARGKENLLVRWLSLYQPLLTFGWLSVVLLNVMDVNAFPWTRWLVSFVLAAIVLVFGGWQKLRSGETRGPLLSLFFVAEALVWGALFPHGGQIFLTGVYVFHVAAGSYFHYLGSYFFAHARTKPADFFLKLAPIAAVNAAIIGVGYAVAQYSSLAWLDPVLGVPWFTLWVAVHLVSSDVFPALKAGA